MHKLIVASIAVVAVAASSVGFWQLEEQRQDRMAEAAKDAKQMDELILGYDIGMATYVITADGDGRLDDLDEHEFQLFIDDFDSLVSYYKFSASGQCRKLKNGKVCLIAHMRAGEDGFIRTLHYNRTQPPTKKALKASGKA